MDSCLIVFYNVGRVVFKCLKCMNYFIFVGKICFFFVSMKFVMVWVCKYNQVVENGKDNLKDNYCNKMNDWCKIFFDEMVCNLSCDMW